MIKVRFIFVFFLLFLFGSAVSIYIGHQVRLAEERLARVERAISLERSQFYALEAEWAFLNKPARLERLAVSVLNMAMPETVSKLESGDLRDRNKVLVQHLMLNQGSGIEKEQRRFPAYVLEKPVLDVAYTAQGRGGR
tara:strand:- start:301 stop:714 length:414 start_codon:yes stop_codon:yes gene_type:complete